MKIKKSGLAVLLIISLVLGIALGAGGMFYASKYFLVAGSGDQKLEFIKELIQQAYYQKVDPADLYEGIYKGVVLGLEDPYSAYLSADELDDYKDTYVEKEYGGVGITMQADYERGGIKVIRTTPDSPAEKGGVVRGEYILSVGADSFTVDQLDECAEAVRGEAGTDVVINFLGLDGSIIRRTFTREMLIEHTVGTDILEDGNLAYITVSKFSEETADDFGQALDKAEEAGVKGIILDLRDNPGGLVDAAQAMADMLMDSAVLVYTEDQEGNKEYIKTSNGTSTELPVVVLVNEASASSSEILAGGLQDNGRCKVVGVQSYGKGIIQQLIPLSDGSAVKLTRWQYFTPSGKQIHKVGITPDYEVILPDDAFNSHGMLVNDLQLEKAIELLK